MKKSSMINKSISLLVIISFISQCFLNVLIIPEKANAAYGTCNPDIGCDDPATGQVDLMKTGDKPMNNQFAINAIENRLKLNGFDKKKLEEYSKVAPILKQNPNMTLDAALKQIGAKSLQPYDIRLLNSLYEIVTPTAFGGGGHEWLNVKTIAEGYTCPVCKNEKDYNYKPNEQETFAPHYQGKAAKISEIDYLRFTQVIRDENGQIIDKKKLKLQPIKVEWQEDKPPSPNQPNVLNQNPVQALNGMFGNGFNNWLSNQTGQDYSEMASEGRTMPQLIKEIGAFNLNELYDFPEKTDTAYSVTNLKTLGEETGSSILERSFKDIIAKSGFQGGNLLDWEINIGKTKIESRMGLVSGSLNGDSSDRIITNVGQRKIEDSLKLSEGALTNISGKDDLEEKVGGGYLYKINIDQNNFYGANYNEVRSKNDTEKFDSIFSDTNLMDSLLSVEFGTTENYKNGTTSTSEYKKIIGRSVINQKILFFEDGQTCSGTTCVKTNARDEIFGVGYYNPDPLNPNNPKSKMDRFLDGDNSVFMEIGIDAISKTLVKDETQREPIINWLKNKSVEKDENGMYKINLGEIANTFGLKEQDLWTIFINNNFRGTYQRIGQILLASALDMQNQNEIATYLPNIQTNDFYNTRLDNITNEASKIDGSETQKIIDYVKNAKNIQISDSLDYTTDFRKQEIFKNVYDIEKVLTDIEKSGKNSSEIKNIRYQINEIIEGRELKKPEDYTADQIAGMRSDLSIGLKPETIIKVLKEEESISDFKLKIGLEAWAIEAINADDTGLLSQALDEISINIGKKPSEIIINKLTKETLDETASILNDEYSISGLNAITAEDIALFLNGDYKLLFKIGNSVFEESIGMRQGGMADVLSNKSTWENEKGKSGLGELWKMAGLSGMPSVYDGDVFKRMSQNFLEQSIGLASNTFYGSINDVIGRNGLENVINAFGIQIPTNILQLQDTNPAMFSVKLNDFFTGSLQNSASDYWKNFQNTNLIDQALQYSGLNFNAQTVKDVFTGKSDMNSIIGLAGNVLGDNILNNESIGQLTNASNLVSALKNNNLGSAYSQLGSMFGTNFDKIAGGLPIGQMLNSPKDGLKILTDFSLKAMGNNFGVDIGQFTSFFQNGKKDLIGALSGAVGNIAGIPVGSAIKMFQGDMGGTMIAMGVGQLQSQLGISLPFNDILNVFTDAKPGSAASNQAWSAANALAQKVPGFADMNDDQKNIISYSYYKEEIAKLKKDSMDNVQYSILDAGLGKVLGGNFNGTFKDFFKGDTTHKISALGKIISGISGNSNAASLIGNATVVADLVKYFQDPKNNALPSTALSYIDGMLGAPIGTSSALFSAISGNTAQLTKIGESMVLGQALGFLDGALGQGTGAMIYSMYSMASTYQSLASNLTSATNNMLANHTALTQSQFLAAQSQLSMFSAGAIATVANMLLGGTLSQLDQSIGLPGGTSSLLLTGLIYSVTVPGISSAALLGVLGPQIALLLLPMLIPGLFGGGKQSQEIIITGCGYWPLFEEKYLGPDGKCPPELVIQGQMDDKIMKAYFKKVADYKIKLLLSNLLKLPNDDRSGKLLIKSEQLQMLPTQERTHKCDHIKELANLAKAQYLKYAYISKIFDPILKQGPGCDKSSDSVGGTLGSGLTAGATAGASAAIESFFVSYIDYGY